MVRQPRSKGPGTRSSGLQDGSQSTCRVTWAGHPSSLGLSFPRLQDEGLNEIHRTDPSCTTAGLKEGETRSRDGRGGSHKAGVTFPMRRPGRRKENVTPVVGWPWLPVDRSGGEGKVWNKGSRGMDLR